MPQRPASLLAEIDAALASASARRSSPTGAKSLIAEIDAVLGQSRSTRSAVTDQTNVDVSALLADIDAALNQFQSPHQMPPAMTPLASHAREAMPSASLPPMRPMSSHAPAAPSTPLIASNHAQRPMPSGPPPGHETRPGVQPQPRRQGDVVLPGTSVPLEEIEDVVGMVPADLAGTTALERQTIRSSPSRHRPPAPPVVDTPPPPAPGPTEATALESVISGVARAGREFGEVHQQLGRGGLQGLGGVATGLGRAIEWAGGTEPATHPHAQTAERVASGLQQVGELLKTAGTPPDPGRVQRDIAEEPAALLDPQWWTYNIGSAAGSQLAFLGPMFATKAVAGGIGRIVSLVPKLKEAAELTAGIGAGSVVEAVVEGGLAYDDAIESGATPEDAGKAAAIVARENIDTLLGTNAAGYLMPLVTDARPILRLIAGGFSEGGQEYLQEVIAGTAAQQVYDPARNPFAGAATAGLMGAVTGGAQGAMMAAPQRPAVAAPADAAPVQTGMAVSSDGATVDGPAVPDVPFGLAPGGTPTATPSPTVAAPLTRTDTIDDIEVTVPVDAPPIIPPPTNIVATPSDLVAADAVAVPDATRDVSPGAVDTMPLPSAPSDPLPGVRYQMPARAIRMDPESLQFRAQANREGLDATRAITEAYDPKKGGILAVWRDPQTGETKVVNGHHRLAAAQRDDASVAVVYIDAPTAAEARTQGALLNIDEDHADLRDAVQLFVDGGFTKADLETLGISPRSRVARDAEAVASLAPGIRAAWQAGEVPDGIAVALGRADLSPEQQAVVQKVYLQQQAKGRELPATQISILARRVKAAPETRQTSDQGSIFDVLGEERGQNLFVERAALEDWLVSQLGRDKRLFGTVSRHADRLTEGGTQVDVVQGERIAAESGQAAAVVRRLADVAGPVSRALNEAATRVAAGENLHAVRTALLDVARTAARAELGTAAAAHPGAKGTSDARVSTAPEGRVLPNDTDGSPRTAVVARRGGGTARAMPPATLRVTIRETTYRDRPGFTVSWRDGAFPQSVFVPSRIQADAIKSVVQQGGGVDAIDRIVRDGPPITTDTLPTGERQPRLPEAGEVRDREVVTPPVAAVPEPEFRLRGQSARAPATQGRLFGMSTAATSTPMGGDALRQVNDYTFEQPPSHITNRFRGRAPISEHQVVNTLRRIFAVSRESGDVLDRLAGSEQVPLPTRRGRSTMIRRGRALGVYNTKTGSIRLKRDIDLSTFVHELGHHIDFALFEQHGRPMGLFKDELLRMGEGTTPPSMRGVKKHESYQLAEGVAEFFRIWFPDPARAKTVAPKFSAALDEVMQRAEGFGQQLEDAQSLVQRYLSQDLATRGVARISIHPRSLASAPIAAARRTVRNVREAYREGGSLRATAKRVGASVLDSLNVPKWMRDPHQQWQAFRKQWIDDLDAIQRAVFDMAGDDLSAADHAYVLARIARGTAGKAQGFLEHGVRDLDGQFLGPSLRAALAPVMDRLTRDEGAPYTRPDLASYLVALRARELHTRTTNPRDPGMKLAEAELIIRATEGDARFEQFAAARDAVYAYQRSLLAYARQAGAFSEAQITAIQKAGEFYVPLQRVLEEVEEAGGGSAKRIADRVSPIKSQKGSGRDIIDPFESIVKNTATIVDMVEKNRAMIALTSLADETTGSALWLERVPPDQLPTTFRLDQLQEVVVDKLVAAGTDVPEGIDWSDMVTVFTPTLWGDPKHRIVTVIKNGKRQFYQVQDEALYQAITAIGPAAATELMHWMAKPTAVLRAGATLTPGFIIRNLLRDTVGAMLQSRHGFIPVIDTLGGWVSMFRRDADWQLYQAAGVQQAALLGQDRDRVASVLDELGDKGWRRRIKTALHPLDALRRVSEQIENATRVGEFKLALRNPGADRRVGVLGIAQRMADTARGRNTPITERHQLARATLAARDVTVDFSRGGTSAKEVSQFKAFFNARTQGFARIAETVHRDPTGAAITVAGLSALSLALWMLNKDDEDYQTLTHRERMDYWWYKLPGNDRWLRIPKPHEWGAIPNVVEGALNQVYHEQPDEIRRMMPILQGISWTELATAFTFTFVLPALEAASNYDTYRRRPIVSPFDEMNLLPEDQYSELTSETMKLVGKALGVSPAKLEHLVVGYTASAGRAALDLTDPIARLITGRPARSPVKWRSEQWPGLGVVLRDASPTSYAQPLQDFYQERAELQRARGTQRARQRAGDAAGIAEINERYGARFTPEHVARIQAADDAITELRGMRDQVDASADLTPAERKRAREVIHRAMVRWAATATWSPTMKTHVLPRAASGQ